MNVPIRRGGIYSVFDTAVNFPPLTPKDRNYKPTRPFLVISNDTENTDPAWLTVMGFPLTTSDEFKSAYDVDVAKGVAGLTEDCCVRVVMLQPMAKTKLQLLRGQLPANTVEAVIARHLSYIGAI